MNQDAGGVLTLDFLEIFLLLQQAVQEGVVKGFVRHICKCGVQFMGLF